MIYECKALIPLMASERMLSKLPERSYTTNVRDVIGVE
jgi:hypothetical protein